MTLDMDNGMSFSEVRQDMQCVYPGVLSRCTRLLILEGLVRPKRLWVLDLIQQNPRRGRPLLLDAQVPANVLFSLAFAVLCCWFRAILVRARILLRTR